MASTFSFDFGGDDIDETDNAVDGVDAGIRVGDDLRHRRWKQPVREEQEDGRPVGYEPRWHMLDELVCCLSFLNNVLPLCLWVTSLRFVAGVM
jgi:hypothetical protein